MKHIFVIVFSIVVIEAGIFLPYIHGDYDFFAVGLSYIFQFAAFTSLLLVPLGLIWFILNIVNGKNAEAVKYPVYIRKSAFVVTVIIVLAAALGAFASNNRFSAIIILAIGVFTLFILRKRMKDLHSVPDNIVPYYFMFIPLSIVFFRLTYLEKVKENATDFVITQSEQLIHDIEEYKKINGHYPISLLSTIEDYKPLVSGIPRFHYELNGDAYNLYFEQISSMIGTEEIVMYNKLGEHEMTVHNQDLLRIAPASIRRGYHKVADHFRKDWKIFYFD
ncbi:MAG: hypothetical protein ABL895_05325 [Cyclobacteriaceae bacterium]